MSNATVALILAELHLNAFVEANGADGSEEYQALTGARNAAASAYEDALRTFIQGVVAA